MGGGGNSKFGFSVAGRMACGARPLPLAGSIAGEGNDNGVSRAMWGAGFLPWRSKEGAGVRGRLVRGMVQYRISRISFTVMVRGPTDGVERMDLRWLYPGP